MASLLYRFDDPTKCPHISALGNHSRFSHPMYKDLITDVIHPWGPGYPAEVDLTGEAEAGGVAITGHRGEFGPHQYLIEPVYDEATTTPTLGVMYPGNGEAFFNAVHATRATDGTGIRWFQEPAYLDDDQYTIFMDWRVNKGVTNEDNVFFRIGGSIFNSAVYMSMNNYTSNRVHIQVTHRGTVLLKANAVSRAACNDGNYHWYAIRKNGEADFDAIFDGEVLATGSTATPASTIFDAGITKSDHNLGRSHNHTAAQAHAQGWSRVTRIWTRAVPTDELQKNFDTPYEMYYSKRPWYFYGAAAPPATSTHHLHLPLLGVG